MKTVQYWDEDGEHSSITFKKFKDGDDEFLRILWHDIDTLKEVHIDIDKNELFELIDYLTK